MSREDLRKRYARVFHSLGRAELQTGALELDDFNPSDLLEPMTELWMGFYTAEGLHVGLERYGLFDEIRRLGYEEFTVSTGTEDADEHLLRIHSILPRVPEPLIELVSRRSYLNLSGELGEQFDGPSPNILSIEWLLLQNPLGVFDARRPPLPGQRHRGSGLAENIFELLRNVCLRIGLAGLATVPSFFHNALLYSQNFSYMDPHYEGRFDALASALDAAIDQSALPAHLHLAAKSWAVKERLLIDKQTNERAEWFFEPMLSPITPKLQDYLSSDWYEQERHAAELAANYIVLLDPIIDFLGERGIYPFDRKRILTWLEEND